MIAAREVAERALSAASTVADRIVESPWFYRWLAFLIVAWVAVILYPEIIRWAP